jgi:hypothetical protein
MKSWYNYFMSGAEKKRHALKHYTDCPVEKGAFR